MRDRETIDSELRLIALRRQSARESGALSSSQQASHQVDRLLDERLGHHTAPPEAKVAGAETRVAPRRRKGTLRRIGPLALVPMSILAVAAAFVTAFGGQNNTEVAAPADVPPLSTSQTKPQTPQAQAPQAQASPLEIADRVFIDVLNHDGVPVPSSEYATTHAHAVCGFLTHQPNLADAVRFVQQSTVWDADQSAHFAVGAVVSYCPEYESASVQIQPGLQNSLSDLQAIQRDLRDIQGGLDGIRDRLPIIPGE